MPLTQTSLSAAITASQLRLPVTNTSVGFPAVGVPPGTRQVMQIDAEKMLIVQVPVVGFVDVAMRGYDGTAPDTHDILAPVFTSANASDFQQPIDGQLTTPDSDAPDAVTIGQDVTFAALPIEDTIYTITKATAAAIVFPPAATPGIGVGIRITVISAVAAAHTITYTPGFFGDTTSSDVASFPLKAGASIVFQILPSGGLGVVGGSGTVTLA